MQEIRKFPLLEPEQEYMLAKAWVDHGDKDAAQRFQAVQTAYEILRQAEERRIQAG